MTAADAAKRITAHLRRMENDPAINRGLGGAGARLLYSAHARAEGGRVFVTYVSYQGSGDGLELSAALAWLDWLDAGNSTTHHA